MSTVEHPLANDKFAYPLTTLGSVTEEAYNTDASVVPVLLYTLDESLRAENLLVGVGALYIELIVFCRRSPSGREKSGRTLFLSKRFFWVNSLPRQ